MKLLNRVVLVFFLAGTGTAQTKLCTVLKQVDRFKIILDYLE